MFCTRLLLPVALAFGVASVDWGVAQDKKPKETTDQEKLQGAWRVVSSESAGTKFGGGAKLTFKDKLVRWEQEGGAVESIVQLAPAKTPKHIDLWAKPPAGKKAGELRAVGIYKFDGDKLYLCITVPNK